MTLQEKAQEFGLILSQDQIRAFDRFYEMLIEKNKVMNLTAVTDYDMVLDRHFADSLSIAAYIDMEETESVMDIGTGAGFPSVPLKIAFPYLHMTLLDSLNKRLQFLETVKAELMFDNFQTLHARAEDAAHEESFREAYDLTVSRAVADLSVLCEYCLPFVKKGGIFVAYKSAGADQEILKAKTAIRVLGGEIEDIHTFILPGSDLNRCLVCIRKVKNTPAKYPRKAGTPSKSPIQ